MKTEQINLRLEPDLVAAVERVAKSEGLDRATAMRRLLHEATKRWGVERALDGYRRGELSIERAAEEAGRPLWEMLDLVRGAGIAYPLTAEEAEERLAELDSPSGGTGSSGGSRTRHEWMGEKVTTLADIPPEPGHVLLVGINPAPRSVAAGHYYQGKLGRRLWKRLSSLGLLADAVPGREDEAFARAGHGLTDLVKRPTTSSAEVAREELEHGSELLREKVSGWKPALILFPFKKAAESALATRDVRPGRGQPLEGVPTFLLTGPYASREDTRGVDGELRRALDELNATNSWVPRQRAMLVQADPGLRTDLAEALPDTVDEL